MCRAVRKTRMIPLARRDSRFNVQAKTAAWVRRSVTPMAQPMLPAPAIPVARRKAREDHRSIPRRAPELCIQVELDLRSIPKQLGAVAPLELHRGAAFQQAVARLRTRR